jgi:cystathionine beta-lyase
MLRARGSFKWTAPGPDGFGAAVAEMDFGAAPAILDALAGLSADANFGYLPQFLADELAAACAEFQKRRYGWHVDPAEIHHVPDVIKALEIAITHFSRPGSPVILPTPAYMPFLVVPGFLGREIIQVQMRDDAGLFTLDLAAIEDAFRAGGDLLIFCNPYNPLGRVFTREEMTQLAEVVDRHNGRVFADEIHGPLVYPGARHIPYASTSDVAASHALTATSASKAWNLPGLKCAQVILTNEPDRQRWEQMGVFASHGASNPGVVANIAAFRHGEAWLDEVLATCRRCATARPTAPTSPGSTAPRWTCWTHPARSSPTAGASPSWTDPPSAQAGQEPSGSTSPRRTRSSPRWSSASPPP